MDSGNVDKGVGQWYNVTFSDGPSWMSFENFASRFSNVEYLKDGPPRSWIVTAADLLGFRYIYFGSSVVSLNGRLSSIRHGVANELVRWLLQALQTRRKNQSAPVFAASPFGLPQKPSDFPFSPYIFSGHPTATYR